MDWMLPDISIILVTIVIVFLIFLRVGRQLQVRETFFQLWVLAWLLSIVHYLGQLAGVVSNASWGYLISTFFLSYSGIVFVIAAQSLRGKALKGQLPYAITAAVVLTTWGYVDAYQFFPTFSRWLPFEGGLAVLFTLAGISHYLHQRKLSTIGGAILSYTFFFWALCFFTFAIWGDSAFFTKYSAYLYQFSNLPKPVAAIGMLIFLLECQKVNAQRQRDFAESLIENAPDGIFILDRLGHITRVNRRFEEICGLTAPGLLGKAISSVIHPPGPEGSEPGTSTDWDGKGATPASTAVTVNASRNVLVTSEPILNGGEPIGTMGIVKDITDRLHLEQQLRQSEKMASIGLMVSGVAHELNNPLTSVIGFAELALREPSTPASAVERIRIVLSEARRTRGIVQKLLSAIRQQKSARLPLRLNQIVRDTVALREHDFRMNNIEIVADLDPNVSPVMADASDLQQVLINLMQNAFDAIGERSDGGRLTIRTGIDENYALLEVSDDGSGVADIGRAFDPFYTTKEVGKGTGLGLSICYQIVRSHGGEIFAENLARGARFTVRLPMLASEPDHPAAIRRPSLPSSAKGRILVVDDEPMVLVFCEDVLTQAGFTVEKCATGAEAIQKLDCLSFDAIVTDYKMPGSISGTQLYQWVSENRPGLEARIIFMTGDSVNPSTHEFISATGIQVVFKPFEPDELVAKVNAAISATEAVPQA